MKKYKMLFASILAFSLALQHVMTGWAAVSGLDAQNSPVIPAELEEVSVIPADVEEVSETSEEAEAVLATPADAQEEVTINITSWQELADALEELAEEESGKLVLQNDVIHTEEDEADLLVPGGPSITLDLNGNKLGYGEDEEIDSFVIEVDEGGDLTIEDNADGSSGCITGGSCDMGGGIYVMTLGKLTLNSGRISGNTAKDCAGAIYLENNAVFDMNGGEISGNNARNDGEDSVGGAVFVSDSAVFTMKGGLIENNRASLDGGAVYVGYKGVFNMDGGSINNNEAITGNGGGVHVVPAGVFRMTGGEIANCMAVCGGAVLADGTVSISGGELSYNRASKNGGGIYAGEVGEMAVFIPGGDETDGFFASADTLDSAAPAFTMSGGRILGCSAAMSGGGLYLDMDGTVSGGTISSCISESLDEGFGGGGIFVAEDVTLALSDAILEYNDAPNGGCIYNKGSTEMTETAICGNTALEGAGIVNEGTVNMHGGSISENAATIAAGGISNRGTFRMTGGTISGNSDLIIGGIYNHGELILSGGDGDCRISGNMNASGESNVSLPSGVALTVDEDFTGGEIGITAEDEPELGVKVKFAEGDGAEAAVSSFTSDQGYSIVCEDGALYLEAGLSIGEGSGTAVYGDDLNSDGITYDLVSPAPVAGPVTLLWSEAGAPSAWTMSFEEERLSVRPCDAAGTAFAQAGTYYFRVQVGDAISENEAVFTVVPREAQIEWTLGQLYYNGNPLAPSARVTNLVGEDEVTVTVTGAETKVGTGYTATAEALAGSGSHNYALPVPLPTTNFSIIAGNAGHDSAGEVSIKRAATYSSFWFRNTDGIWQIRDRAGQAVAEAWLCDDAIAANGKNVWYLLDSSGRMVTAGFVQDATGQFYSLETAHNGYFGMLRHQDGWYDCGGQQVYLTFSRKHDGTFGAVTNADGIEKLKAIYGVTRYGIGNESLVYTSQF